MRRVLLDVNVVLDVLLDRWPHAEASSAAWVCVENGVVEGFLAAHALTTIHCLARKSLGPAKARQVVFALLRVFQVAPVDRATVEAALHLACPDFEDAVTAAAARFSGCEYIVTRDPRGFRGSPVPLLTPETAAPLWTR